MAELTHFNDEGHARMVDVSDKKVTLREAVAGASVHVNAETFSLIKRGEVKKGDVLAVAQVAGIMAAKRTSEIIPMCHPIVITGVDISFTADEVRHVIDIKATVRCKGETGVEMEALTAATATALTIYDMCKAVQKDIEISNIRLISKTGGKSGDYSTESEIPIMPKVKAVCVSEAKGVVKTPVPDIYVKINHGIVGDAHAGESHRQVSLLAEESVNKLREKMLSLEAGVFAENILTKGICLYDLPVGTKLRIGQTLLEVTQIGKDCHNDGCAIKKQTGDCVMPREGIFASVLKEGIIKPGDEIEVENESD
jgi:cyclic pyranopterin phosphate synthase